MIRRILPAALAIAVPLAAQPAPRLTLADALRRADEMAYANRGAVAMAESQQATALGAMRGVLPGVRAEGGAIRTTDPINAFAFALKQRTLTMASFNPALLNDPAAITNFSAGLVLEQPIANVDAWMGLKAARAMASASTATRAWVASGVRVDVAQAYYGAVVAGEMAATLRAAERSAREHVRSAELAFQQGLVTKSDALLASVRAGEISAQRLEAESKARLARQQLALVIGMPADTQSALPTMVPTPAQVDARVVQPAASATRADERAATDGADAAHWNAERAKGSWLPRVNGFARYDWNSPTRVGEGTPSWTVGAMASWSLFGGAAEWAEIQGARAQARGAVVQREGAVATAALERRAADEALAVARLRAAIADTAVTQASEAQRIVRKKYEGGLSSVSELLDAGAAELQARLMQADARYRYLVAAAVRLRAWGADPAALAALDSDNR